MNESLLAKLAWRVIIEPNSFLAMVIQAKYCGKKGWWRGSLKSSLPSNIKQGLQMELKTLKGNVIWSVGGG